MDNLPESEQKIEQNNIQKSELQLDSQPKQKHEEKYEEKAGSDKQQKPMENNSLIMGKYQLGQAIGSGGYSTVYGIKDKQGNDIKHLALKMIKIQQQQKEIVQNEIEHLKKNQSQYVVKLQDYEYNQEKREFYIIMEKCQSSLFQIYLSDINDEQRMKYAFDLIKGVAFIHSQRICHRDLKLQNILLKNNQIKIADFGISKSMEKQLKTFVGTRLYMAPQMYKKYVYTQKVDSWAIGIILLELFCRKRISDLQSQREPGALQQQFPSGGQLDEIKNKYIKKIIKNLLEKQAEKRWSVQVAAAQIRKKQKRGNKIEQSQQQQIYEWEETRQLIQI